MYKEFEHMPINSRIWVYQASRTLTAGEVNKASYFLKNALEQWQTHGNALIGSFKFEFDRFFILAVDEQHAAPSGCSIDSSTHWLKQLGEEFGVDFFDRSLAYLENKEIKTIPVFSIKKAMEAGQIQADTWIFNTNVNKISEFIASWKVQATKHPFISKYFKGKVA